MRKRKTLTAPVDRQTSQFEADEKESNKSALKKRGCLWVLSKNAISTTFTEIGNDLGYFLRK